jgi:hypothetical protein
MHACVLLAPCLEPPTHHHGPLWRSIPTMAPVITCSLCKCVVGHRHCTRMGTALVNPNTARLPLAQRAVINHHCIVAGVTGVRGKVHGQYRRSIHDKLSAAIKAIEVSTSKQGRLKQFKPASQRGPAGQRQSDCKCWHCTAPSAPSSSGGMLSGEYTH